MNLSHDTYGISMPLDTFKNQMQYIKKKYNVISLTETFPQNETISITIDDGYKDTIYAAEILESLSLPFTLFMTSDNINKSNYLSANDIQTLSDSDLCNIGSHTKTHVKLGELDNRQQIDEVTSSKLHIEDIIGKKINLISLPHGSYNRETFKIIKDAGYEKIATSIKGFNATNDKIIKRSEVIKYDTFKSLEKKISGYYDFY